MDELVMKELLESIKEDIREVRESQKETQRDINEIKITQVEQHVTLVDHTKRSTANEEEIRLAKAKFENELEPIKRYVSMSKGVVAFIGFGLTVLTILALLKII